MTARQFIEWQVFYALDPFGELRADYRAASIVQMIANVNRGKGAPYKLKDFLLKFGESEPAKARPWREQKAMMGQIFAAYSDLVHHE